MSRAAGIDHSLCARGGKGAGTEERRLCRCVLCQGGGGRFAPQDEFKLADSCWLLAVGRQRKSRRLIEVCNAGRESLLREGVGGPSN